MKISTFWYSIKQGMKSIRRNLIFSLASIGTIVACLFLFGIFYAIVLNFKSAMNSMEDTVAVSVFFNEGMEEDQIATIGKKIGELENISSITFVSAEEAWEDFVEEHYGGDMEYVSNAFEGDNPLENSASYNVTLKNISEQGETVKQIETISGVRKVNSAESTVKNLTSLNALVGYASISVVVILLFVSVFLISNTITIGITVRKEEIAIMKLIGATDFFVRAPFMVEGIMIGFIGSVVPVVILYFMYNSVTEYLVQRFKIIQSLMVFVPTKELFISLLPISLGIGIGVGFFGSLITTFKHLRV